MFPGGSSPRPISRPQSPQTYMHAHSMRNNNDILHGVQTVGNILHGRPGMMTIIALV